MLDFIKEHYIAIAGFIVALLADLTVLFPSLKDNTIVKAINGVLGLFAQKATPPAPPAPPAA